MIQSLYVHIPFCHHICTYCDFAKVFYKNDWADQYLIALKEEMKTHPTGQFKTIYIGGGTPSALSLEQIKTLLVFLNPYTQNVEEYTVEVNPESASIDKLSLLKQYGVNRLSIGVQTTNNHLLQLVGRKHRMNDVIKVIQDAKAVGFKNISLDFMYGLPNQTLQDIKNDLDWIHQVGVQHISYYELILEDHTKLKVDGYQPISQEMGILIDDLVETTLANHQLKRYEISNYALNGYESKHNLAYWHFDAYIGLGLNASSYYHHQRRQNTKNLSKYLNQQYDPEVISLTMDDERYEYLMVGLRKTEGIDLNVYSQLFNSCLLDDFSVLHDYIKSHHLMLNQSYLSTTKKGYLILNDILVDCLK